MAESVLTTAHAHAHQAAAALNSKDFSIAANESQAAATDFAKASRATTHPEALRVLKLLEEQHQRLARICKAKDAALAKHQETSTSPAGAPELDDARTASNTPPASERSKPSTAGMAAAKLGSHVRDSSPSLARDIASRRGIPPPGRTQQPAGPQARGSNSIPESRRSTQMGPGLKVPPSIMDSQSSLPPPTTKRPDDDGFTKFYNSLTIGTYSKLSSVLAFAGLPLTADDIPAPAQPASDSKATGPSSKHRATASTTLPEQDITKIFSKAALAALEDRGGNQPGHTLGPAESFYLVQPTGGTVSYADMAKIHQQQQNLQDEDDDTAFVDASEVPPAARQSTKKHGNRTQATASFGKPKTGEELELENQTLKATLELLNSRLAAFEAHAQDASMAALTQSMVSLRGGPPPPRQPHSSNEKKPKSSSDEARVMAERIRALEQQLEKRGEDEQSLRELVSRQDRDLRKWGKKFEALQASAKERARARRENQGVAAAAASAANEGEEK